MDAGNPTGCGVNSQEKPHRRSRTLLWSMGQTLNIMTLGGFALAVGILVDDATVVIENIERQLGMRDLQGAIIEGSREIGIPALVSTLAICTVFAPIFLLRGT